MKSRGKPVNLMVESCRYVERECCGGDNARQIEEITDD